MRAIVAGRWPGYVALRGELDIATATDLLDALAGARVEGRPLVIDVRDVTFLGCVAVDEILSLRASGCRVVVSGPSRAVRRVLRLTGADRLVEIRAD